MSDAALKAMQAEIDALKNQVGILEDVNAIRWVQHTYGYYIDKCLYDEAVEMFSDTGEVHFLNGVYKGRAGARRLYCNWFREFFTRGHNGPIHGFLLDHLIMQDVVHVAPDRMSAKARFRTLLMGGSHESKTPRIEGLPDQFLEGGIYENTFVKEGGVWKIQKHDYNMLWQCNLPEGWAHSAVHMVPLTKTFPEDPNGPDALIDMPRVWPDTRHVPFHYPHPVTGKPNP